MNLRESPHFTTNMSPIQPNRTPRLAGMIFYGYTSCLPLNFPCLCWPSLAVGAAFHAVESRLQHWRYPKGQRWTCVREHKHQAKTDCEQVARRLSRRENNLSAWRNVKRRVGHTSQRTPNGLNPCKPSLAGSNPVALTPCVVTEQQPLRNGLHPFTCLLSNFAVQAANVL